MPDQQKALRTPVRINTRLDKSLVAYVAAAGAAGVAIAATSPAAEAKIVYTPANTRLYNGTFPVDLNNDGVADFSLIAIFQGYSFYRTELRITPVAGNAAVGGTEGAAALAWGARVGPNAAFVPASELIASRQRCGSSYCNSGPWYGTQNRYLGVKFSINGATHYGWARLSVGRLPATITGYAYETIPNKPIIAGKTSGPVVALRADPAEMLMPSKRPQILGVLARGSDCLALWRRDEEVIPL